MILRTFWLSTVAIAAGTVSGHQGHHNADFVDVRVACPAIRVDLRYGTTHNGVRRAVYPRGARCLLRRAVAERLCRVERRLEKHGYCLVVWDAYRPLSAQRALWRVKPDPRFVASPWRGGKHNRGAAVDVTLGDNEGRPLPMPSAFDEFSSRAGAMYSGGPREARRNRDRLHDAMRAEGFQQDRREWWHFQAPEWRLYPVVEVSLTRSGKQRVVSGKRVGIQQAAGGEGRNANVKSRSFRDDGKGIKYRTPNTEEL